MTINRRTALQHMLLVAGGVVLLPACGRNGDNHDDTREDINGVLEALADTLLPAGSTAADRALGAKATGAHQFALRMIRDCYPKDQQAQYMRGLDVFDQKARQQFGKPFAGCDQKQRDAHVSAINAMVMMVMAAANASVSAANASVSSAKDSSVNVPSANVPSANASSANASVSSAKDSSVNVPSANASSANVPSANASVSSANDPSANDPSAQKSGDLIFFFRENKNLVMQGYLGSQYFLTKIEVYELVPGRWHGCTPVINNT